MDLNNSAPSPPYTDWTTAATVIQDAIDISVAGDEIVVTNGLYQTGARIIFGSMPNRVAVTKAITVRSVNGPETTIIQGFPTPDTNGINPMRCVFLTNNAKLFGFTLTNGTTRVSGNTTQERNGGGVWCASASAVVSNCVLISNWASLSGGGVYSGTLSNCTLSGNLANSGGGASGANLNGSVMVGNTSSFGGGAYSCKVTNCALIWNASYGSGGGAYSCNLNNCTLTGNRALIAGGGDFNGSLYNCISYYNLARDGVNYSNSVCNFTCTDPLPSSGVGNIATEPLLASATHLSLSSPCRSAGSITYARGVDLDGEPWANPPSIGCDEFNSSTGTGPLNVTIQTSYTTVAVGFNLDFTASINGWATASQWDFGDGTTASNRPYSPHNWSSPGDYTVRLRADNASNPGGVSATILIHVVAQPVHYVNGNNGASLTPYSSWATAAATIQDAIDAASVPGALVLVSNGVYGAGGKVIYGGMSNRVAVTLPLFVQSMNGPAVTTIQGYRMPGTTNGNGAVRCVYLTNGASLSGFTLANGATRTTGDTDQEQSGGGAWCSSLSVMISNCVLTSNAAYLAGGGAFYGTFNNCTIISNSAPDGAGVAYGNLTNCVLTANSSSALGGGTYFGMLNNCSLTNNFAGSGGGAYGTRLTNCVLAGNFAFTNGGGICSGILNNCNLNGNSAQSGGGACSNTLNNCILTGNSASLNGGGAYYGTLTNCVLTNNSALSYGGGTYIATVNGCTLASNTAGQGGGSSGGILTNCILTANSSATSGGGSDAANLNNCILNGNSAAYNGGGANSGNLTNCVLTGNLANYGGGARSATLKNCTLTGNRSLIQAGGVSDGNLYNCIVYYNSARADANYAGSSLSYCCTTPMPTNGIGNIAFEPQLASASHLSVLSPCRGFGSATYARGVDIDGESWASPPSIGCDEFYSGTGTNGMTLNILANYTNVAVGFSVDLTAIINGPAASSQWDLGDGTMVTNLPYISHAWVSPGNYSVVLRVYNNSYPGGISTTVIFHVATQPVHYVNGNNITPAAPYSSWATAAKTIQDAVDAATTPGAMVLVSNGIYATGGRIVFGAMSNRVAVTRPLVLKSANGPSVTTIQGYQMSGTTNGDNAIRCISLTNGTSLLGFTLTNGATRLIGDGDQEQSGGGVWCMSSSSIVSNCIITANSANSTGGGVFYGTLTNCVLSGNTSGLFGGGASFSILNNCTLTTNIAEGGGGTYYGLLTNCILIGNLAAIDTNHSSAGGGALCGSLNNCTLIGNRSMSGGGGGASSAVLYNCVLSNNYASVGGGGTTICTLSNCLLQNNMSAQEGGGAAGGKLINCMVTSNFSTLSGGGTYKSTLTNCVLTGNSSGSTSGGAHDSTLNNCILRGNFAPWYGGGAAGDAYPISSVLNNCVLIGNSSITNGGGVANSILTNCTLVGNSASHGGGVSSGTLNNCIIYYNTTPDQSNTIDCVLNYCCIFPLPASGVGNISNAPIFIDLIGGNLRLQSNSPCINTGFNGYVASGTDLDGRPRIVDGQVDMGAYETNPNINGLFIDWLQQNNLAIDGSTDFTDSDGDGLNNWQEWRANTNPTNSSSLLKILSLNKDVAGINISWLSTSNSIYYVERSTNLAAQPAFSVIRSNILGQNSKTGFTDNTATNSKVFVYRVGVQ